MESESKHFTLIKQVVLWENTKGVSPLEIQMHYQPPDVDGTRDEQGAGAAGCYCGFVTQILGDTVESGHGNVS